MKGGNNMKSIYRIAALMCATVVPFISCVDEEDIVNPAKVGDEIIFGARAGFENADPDSKTVYSGEFYTVGTTKFERIDWVDKADGATMWDKVEVYSPEAKLGPTAHYDVNNSKAAGEQNDYAYLTAVGGYSLQWSGEDTHHFYAMYPSSEVFADLPDYNTLQQGVKMNGTTLMGTIPAVQNPSKVTNTDGNYVFEPDMRYAYMAAKSSATIEDETVSLNFVPIVTAINLTFTASQEIKVAEIRVTGDGIIGDFTANLSETSWTGTYPVCTNDATKSGDVITVSAWQKDADGNLLPTTVAAGKSLTFTVFLRPGADYTKLKFSISPNGASYVGKTLANGITIPRNKKTVISGVALPANVEWDASKWMEFVDDATLIKKLSLPGSGGSFSYGSSDNTGNYKSQTLTFDQQWQMGIRAFEVITDRQEGSDFASEYLRCNNKVVSESGTNLTVSTVVSRVLAKLAANPKETAMLIFTYQPGGLGAPNRNPGIYMTNAMAYFNTLTSDKLVLFSPDLTMGQARGKLMIVVRPTQNDEDDASDWTAVTNAIKGTNASKILAVNGCGTGKDKWGARGYNVNGKRAYDISNGHGSGEGIFEYYMKQGDYIRPTATTNPSKTATRFNYPTNTSMECWFQEWARVVGQDVIYTGTSPDTYWFESYTEKLANAQEAFTMAISGNYPNYVFINSLCGYLAGSDNTESITPSTGITYGGSGGNIKALAEKLNVDFYNFVLESGMEQATGPTGVVLMDYVSASEADGGSYYLPGVIITNNFKFEYGNSSGSGCDSDLNPDEEEEG